MSKLLGHRRDTVLQRVGVLAVLRTTRAEGVRYGLRYGDDQTPHRSPLAAFRSRVTRASMLGAACVSALRQRSSRGGRVGLPHGEIAHAERMLVRWMRGESRDCLQELVHALALHEQDGARRSEAQRR